MQLTIEHLGMTYRGGHRALDDVSLELGPGVLGLLGPNGAGKTTLMNLVSTLTRPTTGRVLWNGVDVHRDPDVLRKVLGYLPQSFGVYPKLTAVEFLDYLAAVKGLERRAARRRIDALLDLVNLGPAKHRPLGTYSGGMRQRVGIAQALLNDPELLVVDEPTVGLDPEERARFRHLLAELSGDRIVLLSTHIVSDVEMAATEIALLRQGRLTGPHPPERWLREVEGKVWQWVVPSERLAEIQRSHLVSSLARRVDGVHLRVVADSRPSESARVVEPSLEDAYLAQAGKAA